MDSLLDLLVGVMDFQSFLLRFVPELGKPLEEQGIWAGREDTFPTQPGRFRSVHPFSPDRRVNNLK